MSAKAATTPASSEQYEFLSPDVQPAKNALVEGPLSLHTSGILGRPGDLGTGLKTWVRSFCQLVDDDDLPQLREWSSVADAYAGKRPRTLFDLSLATDVIEHAGAEDWFEVWFSNGGIVRLKTLDARGPERKKWITMLLRACPRVRTKMHAMHLLPASSHEIPTGASHKQLRSERVVSARALAFKDPEVAEAVGSHADFHGPPPTAEAVAESPAAVPVASASQRSVSPVRVPAAPAPTAAALEQAVRNILDGLGSLKYSTESNSTQILDLARLVQAKIASENTTQELLASIEKKVDAVGEALMALTRKSESFAKHAEVDRLSRMVKHVEALTIHAQKTVETLHGNHSPKAARKKDNVDSRSGDRGGEQRDGPASVGSGSLPLHGAASGAAGPSAITRALRDQASYVMRELERVLNVEEELHGTAAQISASLTRQQRADPGVVALMTRLRALETAIGHSLEQTSSPQRLASPARHPAAAAIGSARSPSGYGAPARTELLSPRHSAGHK